MRIYADKDLFEEIIIEDSDYPVLNNIFKYHSKVFLDMSEDEMIKEEEDKGFIFEFIHSKGAKGVEPYKLPFDNLRDDDSTILHDIRSIYLLNVNDDKAQYLSSYGIMVFNRNTIEESQLKMIYGSYLDKDQELGNEKKQGWDYVFDRKMPVSNSIVISDDFLFSDEEGKRGMSNLKVLLNAALPESLNIDFHILILTSEHPKHMDRKKCEKTVGDLKAFLISLNKPYEIKLEFVFTKAIHKRIMISNYYFLVTEVGFSIFQTTKQNMSHKDTDFKLNGLFTISEVQDGLSGLEESNRNLKRIRKVCVSTGEFLQNQKDIVNYRIFGDCNKDKSINNRLLNEFDKY